MTMKVFLKKIKQQINKIGTISLVKFRDWTKPCMKSNYIIPSVRRYKKGHYNK